MTRVIDALSPEGRVKVAVKIAASSEPPAVETFARIAGIDHDTLQRYGSASHADLVRMSQANDGKIGPARAWLAFKFPAPVKNEAPAAYIPDLRSADEKLRDAKASVRQS